MKEFNKVVIENHEKIKVLYERVFKKPFTQDDLKSIYKDFGESLKISQTKYYNSFKNGMSDLQKESFEQTRKQLLAELDSFILSCKEILKDVEGESVMICKYNYASNSFKIQ